MSQRGAWLSRINRGLLGQVYWLLPFLLFLMVRLFHGSPYILIGGDQCKYLSLGRTFPWHQVDNHSLFLLHPPLFGYVIGLLALVFPLLTAGLLAAIVLSVANFIAVLVYGRMNGISCSGMMVGLLFLSLDRAAVAYDTHVSRIPMMLLSFTLALLTFERWLSHAEGRGVGLALGANAFCHLVSDQALQILPCQFIIYLLHPGPRRTRSIVFFFLATLLIFLIWPAVRLWVYATHHDFPAGIDGTIEITQPIPWAGVIQPNLLPFTRETVALTMNNAFSPENFNLLALVLRPLDIVYLPVVGAALVTFSLVVAAFLEPDRLRQTVKWLALSVLLFLPTVLGLLEWYGMGFVIPFSLLLAEGAGNLQRRFPRSERWIQGLGSVVCLAGILAWVEANEPGPYSVLFPSRGRHFLFTREPVTRGQHFCRLLKDLPDTEGIMAPVGLTPEIVYLTGKRVDALPFEPTLLEQWISKYHITRIVLSNELPFEDPQDARLQTVLTARRILEHPQQYRPITAEWESYPAYYPPNFFILLQVSPDLTDQSRISIHNPRLRR